MSFPLLNQRRSSDSLAKTWLIGLSLGLATLLLAGATAAKAAPGVLVKSGDRTPMVPVKEIIDKADVASQSFQQPGDGPTPDGLSLRRLMAMVGVDPDRVTSIRVSGDDGAALTLPKNALKEPRPFGNGPTIPPVIWTDRQAVHFIQTEGGGSPAPEAHATGTDPLVVEVEGGESIAVKARVDRSKVQVGEAVRFEATAAAEGKPRFKWELSDGTRLEGPAVVHRFSRPGRYTAFATVTSGTAIGYSKKLTVTVGEPPPEKKTPRKQKPEPEPSPDEVVAATPSDRRGGPPGQSMPSSDGGSGSKSDERQSLRRERPAGPNTGTDEGELILGELVSGSFTPGDSSMVPGGTPYEEAEMPELNGPGGLGSLIGLSLISLISIGLAREWWRSGDRPWW